jgi:hypothetical protein
LPRVRCPVHAIYGEHDALYKSWIHQLREEAAFAARGVRDGAPENLIFAACTWCRMVASLDMRATGCSCEQPEAFDAFVWFKQRTGYFHLLFFALAVSATAFGAFELALMHEWAPERYADILRWAHVPLALWVLSMIGFVHFYFGAGRSWLAWAASGFRLAGLALNFVTGVNVNFLAVSSLEPVAFWGGAVVAGPVGVVNPWAIVPQIGNLILLMFVIDAAITLWRRGGSDARRRRGRRRGQPGGLCGRRGGLCGADHDRAGPRPDDRHAGRLRHRSRHGL